MADNFPVKLPQRQRDLLKCSNCYNYLSVAPILYLGNELICGRCSTSPIVGENPTTRAKAYETLAQLFTFPCINLNLGCQEQLQFDSAEAHETSCSFRRVSCAALPPASCLWAGKRDELFPHFSASHRDLLINPSSYFYLQYKHDAETNKLMMFNNVLLLLQMRNDIEQGKYWLGLSCLDDDKKGRVSSYSIEFKAAESANNMILQKKVAQRKKTWNMDTSDMFSIDVATIKSFLDSNNILCKIEPVAETKNKPQKQPVTPQPAVPKTTDSLLKELECIICCEYMVPPILLCLGGHSICGVCKETKNVTKCPTCQLAVTSMRNFTLESVTAAMRYPCKNKDLGCKFVGNASNIRSHEESCGQLVVTCAFGCSWRGPTSGLVEHAQKYHKVSTDWALTDTLFRNLKSSVLVDYHLVKFDKKLFKVGFKHQMVTGPVHWVVHEVGRSFTDKPEYKFTLKFVDQSDMGRQFIINNLCYGASGASEFFNCLLIPYHLLKPYVTDEDQLIFQLNIQKIQ